MAGVGGGGGWGLVRLKIVGTSVHLTFLDSYACSIKGDLHSTTLSHATSLRHAYDTNCFV